MFFRKQGGASKPRQVFYPLVPVSQCLHGSLPDIDPTNVIYDELRKAADMIEIENVPAQEALDEAQRNGQIALDEYWAKKD